MPERIEETLLIVEPFTHAGVEYLRGDRVPIRHMAIRRLASQEPEWFAMEYAPEPVDLQWLASLEARFEERYQAVKRAREEEQKRQEKALRQEYETQDEPQHELERRYAQQEAEREKREQETREARERARIEEQAAILGGFNV